MSNILRHVKKNLKSKIGFCYATSIEVLLELIKGRSNAAVQLWKSSLPRLDLLPPILCAIVELHLAKHSSEHIAYRRQLAMKAQVVFKLYGALDFENQTEQFLSRNGILDGRRLSLATNGTRLSMTAASLLVDEDSSDVEDSAAKHGHLVGREKEIARLVKQALTLKSESKGSAIMFESSAGGGKSTLLRHFADIVIDATGRSRVIKVELSELEVNSPMSLWR